MKQISSSIADFYIKRNIIKSDEKEVYQYGFELILNDVITFGLILLLSILFWNVRYGIEFLFVFCLTRIYCGGYHASKSYICRITMITIFCCIYLITAVILLLNPAILYFLLIINLLMILPLIPVKHPNKELTAEQVKRNRKYGILIYLFFSIISIIFTKFISKQDGVIIGLSLCAVTALAIIGTFTNERRYNNEGYKKDFK